MKYASVINVSVTPATWKTSTHLKKANYNLEIKIFIWWKSVGGPRIREKVALERFSCLVCYPLFSILGGRRTFLYRGCKQKRGASIVGQDVSAIRNEPKHAVIKDVSWCNIEKSFHSPTQNIRASANHSNLLDMDGFQAAGNVFLTFHCIF